MERIFLESFTWTSSLSSVIEGEVVLDVGWVRAERQLLVSPGVPGDPAAHLTAHGGLE